MIDWRLSLGIPVLKTGDLATMKGCYQAPTEPRVVCHAKGPSRAGFQSGHGYEKAKTPDTFYRAFGAMPKHMTIGKKTLGGNDGT